MPTFYLKAQGLFPASYGLINQYLKVGDQVYLQHEPDNPYDKNALGVLIEQPPGGIEKFFARVFGGSLQPKYRQIGYVPNNTSAKDALIDYLINEKRRYSATVIEKKHMKSDAGNNFWGVKIDVKTERPKKQKNQKSN